MDDGDKGLTIGGWELAKDISEIIEIIAIGAIIVSVLAGLVVGARTVGTLGLYEAVEKIKQTVGRGLLLGLDLLIAADVIRTVTLEPTLENVAALGLLVAVRTFLSWSLMVELEGRWPWQRYEDVEHPPPTAP